MTKEQKAVVMGECWDDIEGAMARLDRARDHLDAEGMQSDAEQLYRMILKLSQFANKYNEFSVWHK